MKARKDAKKARRKAARLGLPVDGGMDPSKAGKAKKNPSRTDG